MTNIPEIRIRGFTDVWEQRTISDYGYFYYGKSAPKWSVSEDAVTPCIRYGELYTKFKEKIDTVYSRTNIPPEQLKFSTGQEVLVPRVGEVPLDFANCSWLSLPNVAIGEMISVYNTEQNPLFVAIYFNTMLKYEFAEKVEGGNVSNLYYDRLLDIPVKFPSVTEQTQIAVIFDNLNSIITNYRYKLKGLQELKKAYLQVMFPQVGERVPKVRFAGFEGDWVQRKLSEVSDYRNGKAHEQNISDTGKYVVINSKFVSTDGAVRKYTESQIEPMNIGEIAFVLSDVPNGRAIARTYLVEVNGKYSLNQRIAGITPHQYTDSYFLHLLINRNPYFLRFDDGVGQTNLSKLEVENFIAYYPEKFEQATIGAFFHNIDTQIIANMTKIKFLTQLKEAYLRKMLV